MCSSFFCFSMRSYGNSLFLPTSNVLVFRVSLESPCLGSLIFVWHSHSFPPVCLSQHFTSFLFVIQLFIAPHPYFIAKSFFLFNGCLLLLILFFFFFFWGGGGGGQQKKSVRRGGGPPPPPPVIRINKMFISLKVMIWHRINHFNENQLVPETPFHYLG